MLKYGERRLNMTSEEVMVFILRVHQNFGSDFRGCPVPLCHFGSRIIEGARAPPDPPITTSLLLTRKQIRGKMSKENLTLISKLSYKSLSSDYLKFNANFLLIIVDNWSLFLQITTQVGTRTLVSNIDDDRRWKGKSQPEPGEPWLRAFTESWETLRSAFAA